MPSRGSSTCRCSGAVSGIWHSACLVACLRHLASHSYENTHTPGRLRLPSPQTQRWPHPRAHHALRCSHIHYPTVLCAGWGTANLSQWLPPDARHLLAFNEANHRKQAALYPAEAAVRAELCYAARCTPMLAHAMPLHPGLACARAGVAWEEQPFTLPPPLPAPNPCRLQALWPDLVRAAAERGVRLGSPSVSPCGSGDELAPGYEDPFR